MPAAVRAASPPGPPGGNPEPGPPGASPEPLPLASWAGLSSTHRTGLLGCSGAVPQGGPAGGGQGNGSIAVWPLFIRILFGFLFEVYDLPAFQDPATHKFKVTMKFVSLGRSGSSLLTEQLFFPPSASSPCLTAPLWGAQASVSTPSPFKINWSGMGGSGHLLSACVHQPLPVGLRATPGCRRQGPFPKAPTVQVRLGEPLICART